MTEKNLNAAAMLPWVDGGRLRAALPYPALIDALKQAFLGGTIAPTRHVHRVDQQEGTVLLLMPVWQEKEQMGVKLVTVAPGNRQRGLPTVHSVFVLFDTASGEPKALLDGEELTLRRTAAASALAAQYLARKDSASLLVVGTGSLAPHMAAAHCVARPIRSIRVWGRDPDRARAMVTTLVEQGVPQTVQCEVVTDLAQAAAAADIITCATTSTVPLLHREWVRAGTHVDLVGGFKPDMREADDNLMCSASVFVDTFAGTLAEAGDLRQPMEKGLLKREAILAELADLVQARHPGRTSEQEITLFKSVGTGIEDLAAARLAWSTLNPLA